MPELPIIDHKVQIQTDAWLDTRTDMVHVRLRLYVREDDGYIQKKGMILTLSESDLCNMVDGQEYYHRRVNTKDFTEEPLKPEQGSERFEQVADEANE